MNNQYGTDSDTNMRFVATQAMETAESCLALCRTLLDLLKQHTDVSEYERQLEHLKGGHND